MKTREEVIAYCLTYPDVYEDYPFNDPNWTAIRLKKTKKTMVFIFEREGNIWLNVKTDPQWRDFWRSAFEAVVPAYHMNKTYWNSVILDGSIPDKEVERMLGESYDLVCGIKV